MKWPEIKCKECDIELIGLNNIISEKNSDRYEKYVQKSNLSICPYATTEKISEIERKYLNGEEPGLLFLPEVFHIWDVRSYSRKVTTLMINNPAKPTGCLLSALSLFFIF